MDAFLIAAHVPGAAGMCCPLYCIISQHKLQHKLLQKAIALQWETVPTEVAVTHVTDVRSIYTYVNTKSKTTTGLHYRSLCCWSLGGVSSLELLQSGKCFARYVRVTPGGKATLYNVIGPGE